MENQVYYIYIYGKTNGTSGLEGDIMASCDHIMSLSLLLFFPICDLIFHLHQLQSTFRDKNCLFYRHSKKSWYISCCPVAQEIQQDFTWAASSICWNQHRTIARQNSPSITIDCHGSWSTRVDWFFMIFSPCVRVEFCNVRLTYRRGFRRGVSIQKDWLKENVWF